MLSTSITGDNVCSIINIAVGISECKTKVRECVKGWEQIVFQKEVLILVHQGIILGAL
jgi:hypothetical protein